MTGFVADRDVACPACTYNLQGLAGSNCPECGLELRLTVQLTEPSLGVLMGALAGLFGMAGAAGFVVAGFVLLSAYYGDWAPAALWVVPVPSLAIGAGAGLWLGSRGGRVWFRKQSEGGRTAVAVGSWLLGAIAFAAFMAIALNY